MRHIGKRVICKVCGLNVSKWSIAKKGICSVECVEQSIRKFKKCDPCSPESLRTRIVEFSNGTFHSQQYCTKCLVTRYIGKVVNPQLKESRIKKKAAFIDTKADSFFYSLTWLELRYLAFKRYGFKCMCCNASKCELHVDHIKPRSRYPELALDIENLQILCRECNMGKGAWDETDFRPKEE